MSTPYESDVKAAAEVLRKGGIIIYPTDICWAIGCDATHTEAVRKLLSIKQRDPDKGFVVLVADTRQMANHLAAPPPDLDGFLAPYTKPTTIIYPQGIGVADELLAENGSIALRLVKDAFCRALIRRIKAPLACTAANISGDPHPLHAALINQQLIDEADYLVHWRQHDISTQPEGDLYQWDPGNGISAIRIS